MLQPDQVDVVGHGNQRGGAKGREHEVGGGDGGDGGEVREDGALEDAGAGLDETRRSNRSSRGRCGGG